VALWSFPYADTIGEPLVSSWWIPGFTSQNPDYIYAAPNLVAAQGFPSGVTYVTVTGSYFDTMADPTSGYFTFWPSSALTFDVSGQVTYMPQRYSGVNQTLLGASQMGSGKIYLWYGHLIVNLLATDNANMLPVSFTYHVKENFFEGRQYDITVPSVSSIPVDINSLIIPGSIRPVNETLYDSGDERLNISQASSQYIVTEISPFMLGSPSLNPTSYPVSFAFISGPAAPQPSDWVTASWSSDVSPYLAQLLIGPNGHVLAPGSYQVWVQVAVSPQNLVIPVSWVNIY
jgi:hypothetical protein